MAGRSGGRLFALVGSLEVSAGGFGLGLVAAGVEDLLVHVDGLGALVEEVVHLAGAEGGTFAEPVAGVGLRCGLGVVVGGVLDHVVATLGVGHTEEG
jgi:hypothetical protein